MAAPWTPPPGLCAGCRHVRIVETRKGSTFFMCRLSETDPRFPRYPRLPVLQCGGYRPAEASREGATPGGDAPCARDE